MYWSCESANLTTPIFFQLAIKVLYGNITRHTEPLTMHWRKNAGLLDQFHMKHESATATNTALTKYWFCVLFMNQYFKLPFELAWQKKPYLAKTLTEPINLMPFLSTTNANFTCNNQRQPLTREMPLQTQKHLCVMDRMITRRSECVCLCVCMCAWFS